MKRLYVSVFTSNQQVTLAINDQVSDIKMKLGDSGSAYFVREVGSASAPVSPIGASPLCGTPTNEDPAVRNRFIQCNLFRDCFGRPRMCPSLVLSKPNSLNTPHLLP